MACTEVYRSCHLNRVENLVELSLVLWLKKTGMFEQQGVGSEGKPPDPDGTGACVNVSEGPTL